MTFAIPEDLARQFVRRVPLRERSRFVACLLSEKLRTRRELVIEACKIANNDSDIQRIEKEFDGLIGEMRSATYWNCD